MLCTAGHPSSHEGALDRAADGMADDDGAEAVQRRATNSGLGIGETHTSWIFRNAHPLLKIETSSRFGND
jgi:hypothetical protein